MSRPATTLPLPYNKKKKFEAHLALNHLYGVFPSNGGILRLLNEVPEDGKSDARHLLLDTLTQDVSQGWDDTVPRLKIRQMDEKQEKKKRNSITQYKFNYMYNSMK